MSAQVAARHDLWSELQVRRLIRKLHRERDFLGSARLAAMLDRIGPCTGCAGEILIPRAPDNTLRTELAVRQHELACTSVEW